ncbi:ketopantoate reductase family protein [Actinoplanes sp. N902-109]|uniref:ketopantoate reductase family protein n=1 Tax=Actinoplanes sp. (strain N902-109) TaxID=649831 RepID=UPI00032965E4|nr:ketopantoate reductase family protein [Actinoplanes sp. N902-109]AGL19682.1 putative 2-dehydropantoate 2-reductase ApbA [Actinoplanes sp. N902-109]
MRTLVVGAGATGGYFGGRLAQAGKDVTFLVRPARAATLARRGLRIHSPAGESRVAARTVTADTIDGPYDLIVIAVKSYGLAAAIADLEPAVGPGTLIVPLLNGVQHVTALVDAFGTEHVYGGVCRIVGTLTDEGDVVQLTGMHDLVYGPLPGGATDRLPAVTEALSGAGFDSRPSDDIVQELWDKWVFLAAMGVVTTLMRGTVGDVTAVPGGITFALGVAEEALAVAAAAGHRPAEATAAQVRRSVTALGVPATTSMYRDLRAGAPVEADAIIADLVRHADEHGIPVPLCNAARVNLAVYEASRTA